MKIGALRHRVTIQVPSYARATDGSNTITYTGSVSVWARVAETGSTKNIQAEKETVQSDIEVLVRYNGFTSAINEKYQLVWEGNGYQIVGITTSEKKESRTIRANKIQ